MNGGGLKVWDGLGIILAETGTCFFLKIVGRGGDEIFGTQIYGLYLRYNVYIHINLQFFFYTDLTMNSDGEIMSDDSTPYPDAPKKVLTRIGLGV